jgi:hypothetical protein
VAPGANFRDDGPGADVIEAGDGDSFDGGPGNADGDPGFRQRWRRDCQELFDRGATVVALCDVTGGIVNPDGLDVDEALAWVAENRFLRGFPGGAEATRVGLPATCSFRRLWSAR